MAKITEEKILEIQQAYKEIGTFSGVAKKLGCSPATVKKYATAIITKEPEQKDIIKFNSTIPPKESINFDALKSEWTLLSLEEEEALKELRGEI